MPLHLSGTNCANELHLTGGTQHLAVHKIQTLKHHILVNYVLPLYSEQWDVLRTNQFLIDQTLVQLKKYYAIYKTDDLLSLMEMLKIIRVAIDQQSLMSNNNVPTVDKNSVVKMVYKTTKIRLMPEYEIYHHIFGKPNVKQHETYHEAALQDIRRMMTQERITFEQIQQTISNTYHHSHKGGESIMK